MSNYYFSMQIRFRYNSHLAGVRLWREYLAPKYVLSKLLIPNLYVNIYLSFYVQILQTVFDIEH